MNRKIYKEIAKKYGVSVDEVKRDIEAAISATYNGNSAEALAVPRKNALPTPDEFITYCANMAAPFPRKIGTLN